LAGVVAAGLAAVTVAVGLVVEVVVAGLVCAIGLVCANVLADSIRMHALKMIFIYT
jgi:hypothetical protein